jgi:hypothetical protein
MAGLNVGDIVSVTFGGTLFSQRVMNVLHYRVSISSDSPSYVEASRRVAFAMQQGMVSPGLTMLAAQAPEYVLDWVRVQKVNAARERYVQYSVGNPGTYAGVCTSPNVSAVLLKKSESVSRRGLGTFHLPGLPQEGYVGGYLTPAYQEKMNAIGATLLNPVTPVNDAVTVQPVIWTPADGLVYYPITATTLITTLRIMRRRTVGLGI